MKNQLLTLSSLLLLSTTFFTQSVNKQHNNLRKVFKIADKKNGIYKAKLENPIRRAELEFNMLKDPATGEIPENIKELELNYVNSTISNLQNTSSLFGINTNSQNWKNRGPWNVGGRTRALAIDVTNENIIIAGGVSGGIWRTVDGGQSWVKSTGSSDFHSVTSLAQDTRIGYRNIWYYTTGEIKGNSAEIGGNGVYKSTDSGLTWSILTTTASNTPQSFDNNFDYNFRVKVNPINGDVYVASYGGIYKSTDGGNLWNFVLDASYSNYTDITITNSGVLYATASSDGTGLKGIFRSIDGQNWTNISPLNFPINYDRISLDFAQTNENILYFIAVTPSSGTLDHTLLKYTYSNSGNGSGDPFNGGSWIDLSSNIPAFGGVAGNFTSQNSYDLVIGVHPSNSNTVYIGGTNIYRSTTGFNDSTNTVWIGGYEPNNGYSSYENQHPDQHVFVFYPSNANKMLCGNDGGVYLTNNNLLNELDNSPVNWTPLNNGYLTTQPYSVAINKSGTDDQIMAGFQDNGTWFNDDDISTSNWIEEGSGDGAYCYFTNNGLTRYSSSQEGNITRKRYDSIGSFLDWSRITPSILANPLFINPFIIDPNNEYVMYMPDGGGILRNTDLSAIPTFSSNPATANWSSLNGSAVSGNVTALDISTNPANILVYGNDNGQLFKINNANVGNPVNNEISGTNFPIGGYVCCIKIDPSNASNIFVVFSNYNIQSIFMTTNGGISWDNISANLEENPDGSGNGPSVRWIEILELSGDKAYFVGTSTGLYTTQVLNANSTYWTQEASTTIGQVVVPMMRSRNDGMLAVATHANGVYSTKFTSSSSICTSPTALNVNNITSNSVDFSWTAGSTETAWNISYGPAGFSLGAGTSMSVNSSSTTISGLNASTSYDIYVQADCGLANGVSSWIGPLTISTIDPNYTVFFELHTAYFTANGGSISSDGIYIGGGFIGGHDALLLNDSDGDGIWHGIISLPSTGGYFTIFNGNCPNYSCQENSIGQCFDPSSSNYRNHLLGGFSQDTLLVLEVGSCSTPISCAPPVPITTGNFICAGDSTYISANHNGYVYWYDASLGGNLVEKGWEDTLFISPSITTSYFAEVASFDEFNEDFESYNSGDLIAQSSNDWTTWTQGSATEDAIISNTSASSGNNSLYFLEANGDDVVLPFDQAYSTGNFIFEMDMNIQTGAYFNFQADIISGVIWALNVNLDNGVISFDNPATGLTVMTGTYPGPNIWFNISFEADLTAGLWECFIDDNSQGVFSLSSSIGSINLYANTGNEFFIDNIGWASVSESCRSFPRSEAVVNVGTTTSTTDILTSCDSLTWINGITYYSSVASTEIDTLQNISGCDSIVILDLTINNSSSTTIPITACDTFIWDGVTYDSTGVYTKNYSSANSCDSVVTLDLIINKSSTTTIPITACDTFTWDGVTYDSTGIYTKNYSSANSCDSVVTLDLTINKILTNFTASSTLFTTTPFSVQFTNSTPNLSNFSFTWDFGDNTVIQSNNSSVFHQYMYNGLYDVSLVAEDITNGCGYDTLKKDGLIFCSGGPSLSIIEFSDQITVFPNPTKDEITISVNNFKGNIKTEIYDLIGNKLLVTSETTISLNDYAIGIYLIKVAYGDRIQEVKVIKQ